MLTCVNSGQFHKTEWIRRITLVFDKAQNLIYPLKYVHKVKLFCLCFGMHHFVSFPVIVLQQQQNLGRRFGTSKMHLSPLVASAAVRSKAVVLLLLTFCLLLLLLWEFVFVLCFVVRYFMSILVLQSS